MKTAAVLGLAGLAGASQEPVHVSGPKQDWTMVKRAPKNVLKTFGVAMKMSNFEELEAKLNDISNPKSKNYGKWLTKAEADLLTATPAHVVKEVKAWAQSTGAQCRQTAPEALSCAGKVHQIEKLLQTELSIYKHKKNGKTVLRTSAHAKVPAHLEGKVLFVEGLTKLPVKRLGAVTPARKTEAGSDDDPNPTPSGPDYVIVPETLTGMYNIANDGNSASTQGAAEFQGYPAPDLTQAGDLGVFASNTATPFWTVPQSNIIGPFSVSPSAESTLDVQYLGAIGQNNTNYYYTQADWMWEFASGLSAMNAKPAVLSISYAWWELDQCTISPSVGPCGSVNGQDGSRAFVQGVNQLFAKATAQGVTLLAASGDSGAHGRTDPSCQSLRLRPTFPSSSPYVVSVGATQLLNGTQAKNFKAPACATGGSLQCALTGYEVVASRDFGIGFSSGGGFSDIAVRPKFQDDVVLAYMKNTTAVPAVANFNVSGRAAPDIAAIGHNYYIELGGQISSVDGTSAATPVIAGVIANLNAWRLSQGKPVLGYVTPLLYQMYAVNPKAFNDVVQGSNYGTEDQYPCPDGYQAAPGYDATTGLGTPKYDIIKQTIVQMGI